MRYLCKKPGPDLSMIRKMRRIFRETDADVIHTHQYCAKYALPAAMLTGVKHRVHTIHNVAEKENAGIDRTLNKFFFKNCHMVPVALSDLTRDSVAEEYRINRDDIPIVYNGIDLGKCIVKNDYSVNGNFKILHIGRFSEQKNHIGLLKAFRIFHERHPDSELWLIGDGEKKAETEEYIKSNGLDRSVKLLGIQSNVYGYLHDADIFALPSNYEGMPMTLIEAMGTGLPIVATAVGGVPDMLDCRSAILTATDESAIAAAFEKYYSDPDLRKTHGMNAKERSIIFSASKMCENYLKIYSK